MLLGEKERLNIRYEKARCDLSFLLACKKENLLPTFAQPKISIITNKKLKYDIGKLIIKTEIKNKTEIRNSTSFFTLLRR